jgi:hypothetical protein
MRKLKTLLITMLVFICSFFIIDIDDTNAEPTEEPTGVIDDSSKGYWKSLGYRLYRVVKGSQGPFYFFSKSGQNVATVTVTKGGEGCTVITYIKENNSKNWKKTNEFLIKYGQTEYKLGSPNVCIVCQEP